MSTPRIKRERAPSNTGLSFCLASKLVKRESYLDIVVNKQAGLISLITLIK